MEKITLKKIAEMSDDEVYNLSIPRPNRPLGTGDDRGFLFSLEIFEINEDMAECMYVLMKRLSKIQKEN